ncbi:MAG TPA: EF-P lysine aminoacylase EpmA [Kofleriaceae bacterium]|nr:EF-P lysine aminoacylase EpmA [Kofleriaceae bacterium]
MIRGRVVAVTGDVALVRTARGDVKVKHPGSVEPGDLVQLEGAGAPLERVRPYLRGDYPTPDTELARLGRVRLGNLAARSRALGALRAFFASRDFVEVETPLRVKAPGLEVHLTAIESEGSFLITSPEYQMKRLLAAGMERIYQVCKCFRAEEEGAHHASEFTMCEWYRAWDSIAAIEDDVQALVAEVARTVNGEAIVTVGGRRIDVGGAWKRMTVAEAMKEWAGVVIDGDESSEALKDKLVDAGIAFGTATAWDDLFYCAFVDRVEPAIAALDEPLLLVDWPVQLAALARRSPANDRVVERFEAYVGGIELANAFGELTDPLEQRARFEDDLAARRERGRAIYPIDEKLIAALTEGLPPSAGVALGVDRLIMLVLGAEHIRDVLAFTSDEL